MKKRSVQNDSYFVFDFQSYIMKGGSINEQSC